MRKWFRFDWRLLEIANTIKDDDKRLKFFEAIINLWINDEISNVQGISKELGRAMIILWNDLHLSDARAEAWRQGNKKWNKNAQKENTQKRLSQTQDSTHTQDSTQPKQKTEKQKKMEKEKHDENVDLIDKIKAKVESLWLIYKSGANERINATNINKSKKFKSVAERFNMTSEMLALAVIEISMSDKFRAWKITNCETIYRHYDKIINNWMKMQAINQNSIWVLPWA